MKRYILLGIIQLALFLGVFTMLQNPVVYHSTLGKISQNYSRVEIEEKSKIVKAEIPFVMIKDDKFDHWDAAIYKCIRDRWYTAEVGCYHNVRGAFFPLFPFIWKITGLNSIGISIFNYFLFVVALSLLFKMLPGSGTKSNLLTFAVFLTFPTSIIFYLPYTEGLFMITMSIMVLGILKDRYLIYFLGALLMAMVRPATIFVLLAIVGVQVLNYFRERHFGKAVFSLTRQSGPLLLGYFLAAAIQRYYSGSWTTFFDAQKLWQGGNLSAISTITDWSVEGFGMSSFAIFFICIPLSVYLVFFVLQQLLKGERVPIDRADEVWILSLFYLAGIFFYTLLTSGGNIHSFWRFTVASPPFFIVAIYFLFKLESKKIHFSSLYLLFPGIFLFVFLLLVPYGGKRLDFSLAGMYLSVLSLSFLLLKHKWSAFSSLLVAAPLILLNIIWNSFLFNAFLSQAWVFT